MSNPMFPNGEDLPIFSGTPIHVSDPTQAQDNAGTKQAKLAECPICFDTGVVRIKGHDRRCWCQIGEQAAVREALLNHTSKRLARVQRNAPDAYENKDDVEHVLREVAAIQTVADRFGQVGAAGLSTIELLTLLIGEQTPTTAARIIAQFQTLARVHHAAVSQLASVPGMTRRRAVLLQTALELAGRRDATTEPPIIKTPKDVADIVGPAMRGLDHEEMRVVSLSTKNRIVDSSTVYRGSVHTTVIRVGELFRAAMFTNATAVIVMHNHPSGDPTPSPEDVAVTREIVNAGKLLDIDVLDHIVIGDPGFVSLKERGLGFA
jgi:DNA repair protein RadC